MANTDALLERLDRIVFLLNLAFGSQIEEARRRVRADPVADAILGELANDFVSSGELKRRVTALTKQSDRTVNRRLSELVRSGWVESEGAGGNVRYRAAGA